MFKSILALFKSNKDKKPTIQSAKPVPKKNSQPPRRPTGVDRRTADSSDDLMNPLNPLSPLNPISPISIYDDFGSKKSEDTSKSHQDSKYISDSYSDVVETRTRSSDPWGSGGSSSPSSPDSYSSPSYSSGGDSGGGGGGD